MSVSQSQRSSVKLDEVHYIVGKAPEVKFIVMRNGKGLNGKRGLLKCCIVLFLLTSIGFIIFEWELKTVIMKPGIWTQIPPLIISQPEQEILPSIILKPKEMAHSNWTSRSNSSNEAHCQIPTIDPFDRNSLDLIYADKPGRSPECLLESPKFETDMNTSLVRRNATSEFWNSVKCCYTPFKIVYGKYIIRSGLCNPISMRRNTTEIPILYAHINVTCFNKNTSRLKDVVYQDQLSFFRRRKRKELALNKFLDASEPDRLNVIYLGIDGVSFSNFQRFLPKTHQFLLTNLSAIEFTKLNKVGRGTFENLVPVLSGCQVKLNEKVVFPKNSTEDCPLIWELFSAKGYRSIHTDEQTWLDVFKRIKQNKLVGEYLKHNTTYDNYQFIIGLQLGIPYALNTIGCFRHQFGPEIVKNRIIEVATKYASRNYPYYHHAWSSLTSHDNMNNAKYLDTPFHELLVSLKQNNLLNNTLLILNSDHGLITSQYSRTVEGLIEARQPFLYMVFPEWFKSKYSRAYQNIMNNSNALITPYDLHHTLRDVVSLNGISNEVLNWKSFASAQLGLGISLFLPIPNRTCAAANIPEGYCICTAWGTSPNSASDPNVTSAVSFALDFINHEIYHRANGICLKLDLRTVIDGKTTLDAQSGLTMYNVRFQTVPGQGIFSAVVRPILNSKNSFEVLGEIERQNEYGNQSACINNEEGWLRSVCYCRDVDFRLRLNINATN